MCTWAIESSSSDMIDSDGISFAISDAIERCFTKLDIHPELADIYLDGGLRAPRSYFRQHTVIHGDDLFPVISCASILAKVYRDHHMDHLDMVYPNYGFINNKGYGTYDHYKAIRKHGFSPIHRQSFLKEIVEKQTRRLRVV
jgi:ribonuclease HII